MELQIICFVSIVLETSNKSVFRITSYFLFQSVCSLSIIFVYFSTDYYFLLLVLFSFKLGMFPFSGWYVYSLSGLSNLPLYLAVTLQKLPVMMLINSVEFSYGLVFIFLLMSSVNIFVTSFTSISMYDVRSSFIWLSVASTFWIYRSIVLSIFIFYLYFMLYSSVVFCLFFYGFNNHSSFSINLSFLALSGLPPFPDFFLKLFIVYRFLCVTSGMAVAVIIITLAFNVIYIYSLVKNILSSFLHYYSLWLYSIINVLL